MTINYPNMYRYGLGALFFYTIYTYLIGRNHGPSEPPSASFKIGDCKLNVMNNGMSKMPVAFEANGARYSILYPDVEGNINIRHGQHFKLLCAKTRFQNFDLSYLDELMVSCQGNDSLVYKDHPYTFQKFECQDMPKSELIVTKKTCQPEKHTVASVGFRSKTVFLVLYNVCFDRKTKNSLYTWYEARTPYFNSHQKYQNRPSFVNTRELFGNTNVNLKYSIKEQQKTLAKILKSNELADKYIRNDGKHSMSRGHYAAKADFFFSYEQRATFYYANVAPQWQIFNGDKWAKLEEKTRTDLDKDIDVHLIVTGSFGSCTLPDVHGVQQKLFLDLPASVPVPLFFWKLFYDKTEKKGTVYIGLNNPYEKVDNTTILCPNACPNGFEKNGKHNKIHQAPAKDANDGLIYCCNLKAFQDVYGELDPIVFQNI